MLELCLIRKSMGKRTLASYSKVASSRFG